MIPIAKWKVYSGAAQSIAVLTLIAVSGCAARDGTVRLRFVKPGEPTATYDDPNVRAETRPCRSTCASFARCSRRPHPRTASCRRSNRAIPSWRERCSCSRCTRAPRTIVWRPSPIGRRVCSTSPTDIFSARSSWSPATPCLLRRDGEAVARLGHAGSRAERRASRAELHRGSRRRSTTRSVRFWSRSGSRETPRVLIERRWRSTRAPRSR